MRYTMQLHEIGREAMRIRRREFEKIAEKRKAYAETKTWVEDDYIEGIGRVKAKVIVMPTRACSWSWKSGCTMCGYSYEYSEKTDEELLEEFKQVISIEAEKQKNGSEEGYDYLKIFNSGSFLDEREISKKLCERIIKEVNRLRIKRLQVESRPEFIEEKRIKRILKNLRNDIELEIGIGLETSNDFIRDYFINKGFSFADFKKACEICNENNAIVKAYLLFKPPFLKEIEAIKDCINSAIDAEKAGAKRISVNAMNIQRATLVERLWNRGEYALPWLWSIAYALREIRKNSNATLICMPTAGGKKRGAHNRCLRKNCCNYEVLKAIREFSLSQETSHLDRILSFSERCQCYDKWQDFLYSEI